MSGSDFLSQAFELYGQGRLADAEKACRKVLSDRPGETQALYLMGGIAFAQNRAAEAADWMKKAVAAGLDTVELHFNLAEALRASGDLDGAVLSYRRVAEADDNHVAAIERLAQTLAQLGRLEEALPCFTRVMFLKPGDPGPANNLAAALQQMERAGEAENWYRQAIATDPNYATAYNNLGSLLQLMGRLSESIECHEKAIALDPSLAAAKINLANAQMAEGRIPGASTTLRWALMLDKTNLVAHQNLLLCLNYDEGLKAETLYKESRKWGETFGRVEALPAVAIKREAAKREAGQRLKVGFVSPDFRRHSVAYFLEPLLEGLEGAGIEITLYSDVARPDEVTERLKGLAAHWRDLTGLGDRQAAERVRSDGIDILIDLAGHTAGNRLLMFAHQPAPVQASWLGYPATTGLAAIGWRITDAIADPEGDADGLHTERLARLPGFLCYRPDEDAPELYEPPSRSNGYVTFGSFNALAKLSERDIRLMAKLLSRVEGSRLLLKARPLADSGVRARVIERFARAGVGSERLDLLGHAESVEGHLGLYAKIDVALDPVHYNGTTTTCEALWMGVPVVTLAGDRHASRVGASLLTKAGLPELVTASEEDYLATAQGLAGDAKKLAGLRHDLRTRLIASPLLDRKRFAQSFAEAMHLIWNEEAAQSPG